LRGKAGRGAQARGTRVRRLPGRLEGRAATRALRARVRLRARTQSIRLAVVLRAPRVDLEAEPERDPLGLEPARDLRLGRRAGQPAAPGPGQPRTWRAMTWKTCQCFASPRAVCPSSSSSSK